MALELARYNIRVNAILPGYFETEMNYEYFATEKGKQYIGTCWLQVFCLDSFGPLLHARTSMEVRCIRIILAHRNDAAGVVNSIPHFTRDELDEEHAA